MKFLNLILLVLIFATFIVKSSKAQNYNSENLYYKQIEALDKRSDSLKKDLEILYKQQDTLQDQIKKESTKYYELETDKNKVEQTKLSKVNKKILLVYLVLVIAFVISFIIEGRNKSVKK